MGGEPSGIKISPPPAPLAAQSALGSHAEGAPSGEAEAAVTQPSPLPSPVIASLTAGTGATERPVSASVTPLVIASLTAGASATERPVSASVTSAAPGAQPGAPPTGCHGLPNGLAAALPVETIGAGQRGSRMDHALSSSCARRQPASRAARIARNIRRRSPQMEYDRSS